MNISATYDFLPMPVNIAGNDSSDFSFEKKKKSIETLPVPLETSFQKKNSHNYYVVEDNKETVYTHKKTTERIHHSYGTLINIYA